MWVSRARHQTPPRGMNLTLRVGRGDGVGLAPPLLRGLGHLGLHVFDLVGWSAEELPPPALNQPVPALVLNNQIEDKTPAVPNIGKLY